MAPHVVLLVFVIVSADMTDPDDADFNFDVDDVCLSQFHIEKYTMASSDAYRDNVCFIASVLTFANNPKSRINTQDMTLLIFPDAQEEYAPHFKQDLWYQIYLLLLVTDN